MEGRGSLPGLEWCLPNRKVRRKLRQVTSPLILGFHICKMEN